MHLNVVLGLPSYSVCPPTSVADTWLHFATQSFSLASTHSIVSPQGFEPSLAINQTVCEGATYNNTCVFEGQSQYAGTVAVQVIGNQVVANTSDAFQVLMFGSTEEDITAVVIPTTSVIQTGMVFRSTSYGVGAICKPTSPCDWSAYDVLNQGYVLCPVDGTTLQNNTANFTLSYSYANSTTLTDASSVYLSYNLQTTGVNVPQMDEVGENATNPFGFAQMMGWGDGTFGSPQTSDSDYFLMSSMTNSSPGSREHVIFPSMISNYRTPMGLTTSPIAHSQIRIQPPCFFFHFWTNTSCSHLVHGWSSIWEVR